jgi:hypothetical protein
LPSYGALLITALDNFFGLEVTAEDLLRIASARAGDDAFWEGLLSTLPNMDGFWPEPNSSNLGYAVGRCPRWRPNRSRPQAFS